MGIESPPTWADSLSRDDVAHLVVGVAVKRRLARLDDSHELRHVEAARVFVDEISEAPLDRRLELGLIVEADGHLALAGGLGPVLRRKHGEHVQVLRAGVLDGVRLAGREKDAHVRFELVRLSVEVEPALALDDVHDLLLPGELSLSRPAGPEADHALLEQLATVGGVEGDTDGRRVVVLPQRFQVVLVHHEAGDSRHR